MIEPHIHDSIKVVSAVYLVGEAHEDYAKSPDLIIALVAWKSLNGSLRYRVVMSHADRSERDRASYMGSVVGHPLLAATEMGRVSGYFPTPDEFEKVLP